MQSIKEILEIHGFDSVEDMPISYEIKLEVDGFMPLIIKKINEHRLSVAHYYEQNGDLMRDPEIIFDSQVWVAVEYHQDPFIRLRDENGLVDATAFALNTWDDNLKQQGFVEAAEQAASASPAHEVVV
ncbi:hypothetical protein HTZ84_20945 [Haloterrigena sp. SYSU A558-1]|uniref:DUF6908 domain-containing protein n=1 Tax=Haloterrigena gelatinilytica TaxID=2741724 RepID=A0ABX2LM52_9EURY|nr:hypothetical protein [Haloterrigena gelatinilytica]NUC74732.1 hypothetical protein [Haloterrigena gelatinilytica]